MEFSKPGSTYSAIVGAVAGRALPVQLRAVAYRAFARAVGADLDEAELPLGAYASLGDFFARRLRHGARPVEPAADAIIAPCDGVIAARGEAVDGALVQAKGIQYRLADLLASPELAHRLVGGAYITIYLSPKDYHRVHAPVAGTLVSYDYLPGALWPVNRWATARRDALLARNERVVIRIAADGLGDVCVVMVGAAGVGNIRLAHGPDSATLRGLRERRRVELRDVRVGKGDELGEFRLGSTVVMVVPPGAARLTGEVAAPVRFGERIGGIA